MILVETIVSKIEMNVIIKTILIVMVMLKIVFIRKVMPPIKVMVVKVIFSVFITTCRKLTRREMIMMRMKMMVRMTLSVIIMKPLMVMMMMSLKVKY